MAGFQMSTEAVPSVMLLSATAAFGQTPAQKATLTHRGHAKISIGAGLMAFGLLVAPAEESGHRGGYPQRRSASQWRAVQ
jgi:hypothetical protein